jgi:glycerol-3-phosphate acyltransferase PlsY
MNPGATNLIRTTKNRYIGIVATICDAFKSYFIILISWLIVKYVFIGEYWKDSNLTLGALIFLPGVFVIIGHCFPLKYIIYFIKFKGDKEKIKDFSGGKGVSSFGGLVSAISPWLMLIGLAMFFVLLLIFRYVSLSSLLSTLILSCLVWIKQLDLIYFKVWESNEALFANGWYFIGLLFLFMLLATSFIWYRHRLNIIRLFKKTEPKAFTKKENQI